MNLTNQPTGGKRVLLYSSRPENLKLAGQVLEEAGFSTSVASDLDHQECRKKQENDERKRQEWLAALSDDLRNSLAAISNAVTLLKRTQLDPQSTRIAQDILERQTSHLIAVANLLDSAWTTSQEEHSEVQEPQQQSSMANELPIAPLAIPASGPLKRLLVVDDNWDAARSLAMLLENLGYPVWIAHDGQGALDLARQHHPQIFLLDLGLPKIDGYQVAEQLRADPKFSEMLLVAITGHSINGEDSRRRARAAGFDYFLTKPIHLESLQALLTKDSRPPSEPGTSS